MDFQNVNQLNARMNTVSFNFLPLTSNDLQFSWKVYRVFGFMFLLITTIVIISGCMHVSREKFLKDGIESFPILIEALFLILRIYFRNRLMRQLIEKLNDILRVDNEMMKNVVTETLMPIMTPLNFYLSASIATTVVWYCTSLLPIFKKNIFYYEDYRQPAVFSKQPFSLRIFLLGNFFLLVGAIFVSVKKIGVDIYIVHLVLMITAQYRYITLKIATIFRDGNLQTKFDKPHQEYYTEANEWVEKELKALCRHHNVVIHLSLMLKKVLSISCSIIYVGSILRFGTLGIMMVLMISSISLESFLIMMYASGSVVQFYILCSCVQQLLDASKGITNEAFHEKWYEYGPSVKRTFMLMILSNNLECKLSVSDKFILSLPAFMTILNKSYSIALLFLRMQ